MPVQAAPYHSWSGPVFHQVGGQSCRHLIWMFLLPGWHRRSDWIIQYGPGRVYLNEECSSCLTSNQVVLCKHHVTHKLKLLGFLLASTTTRAWKKPWPPTLPLRLCPWEKWGPCPHRYPALPIQAEGSRRVKGLTRGHAKEEPPGSCQHQRPPALHP